MQKDCVYRLLRAGRSDGIIESNNSFTLGSNGKIRKTVYLKIFLAYELLLVYNLVKRLSFFIMRKQFYRRIC
jgi:hypothetical protein